MTLDQFSRKWGPKDPNHISEFLKDLGSTITNGSYQNTLLKVVSDIPNARIGVENTGTTIKLSVGKRNSPETIITAAPAVGLQEYDWYSMLSLLVKNALDK